MDRDVIAMWTGRVPIPSVNGEKFPPKSNQDEREKIAIANAKEQQSELQDYLEQDLFQIEGELILDDEVLQSTPGGEKETGKPPADTIQGWQEAFAQEEVLEKKELNLQERDEEVAGRRRSKRKKVIIDEEESNGPEKLAVAQNKIMR